MLNICWGWYWQNFELTLLYVPDCSLLGFTLIQALKSTFEEKKIRTLDSAILSKKQVLKSKKS